MDLLVALNSVPLIDADAPPVGGVAQYATNGDPATNTPATQFPAWWFNMLLQELLSILTAAGQAPDRTKVDQLLKSIQSLIQGSSGTYYQDTGAANALVITPAPAITAYSSGQRFLVVPSHANTGAATINVNALGVKSIVRPDGSALLGGDIPNAGLIEIVYQGTLAKFALLSASGANVPTLGEVIGPGSGNIPIPASAQEAIIEFCGGGGGGGTGDGGAGGPSGTWQDGSIGGDSTVNGVVAKGGGPGRGGRAAGNIYGGDAGTGGAGTGSSYKGQGGNPGLWTGTTAAGNSSLNGGSSFFGGGGWQNNSGSQNGGYGAGGPGGQTGNSGSFTGATGAGAEARRIVLNAAQLAALAGNIPYSLGAGGAGGAMAGNFPGGNGGPGYLRYQFNY